MPILVKKLLSISAFGTESKESAPTLEATNTRLESIFALDIFLDLYTSDRRQKCESNNGSLIVKLAINFVTFCAALKAPTQLHFALYF